MIENRELQIFALGNYHCKWYLSKHVAQNQEEIVFEVQLIIYSESISQSNLEICIFCINPLNMDVDMEQTVTPRVDSRGSVFLLFGVTFWL